MNKVKQLSARDILSSTAAKSVLSLLVALLIGGIILGLFGYDPLACYGAIVKGSLLTPNSLINTMVQMTPLIFTGLAFAFSSKSGLINLGMEGQMLMGALAAAIVGSTNLGLPSFLHLPLTILAGMVAGGLYGLLAGFLKAKFGASEFIVTLMLNYVAIHFCSYLLNGPLKAKDAQIAQSELVQKTAMLPEFIKGKNLTIALVIGVVLCFLVHLFLNKMALGYEIRAVGRNQLAAETAGISTNKVTLITMFFSGAIAALAGVSLVLGVNDRFVNGAMGGYGFNGIAISALASNNPLAVVLSGFVFGALRAGSLALSMSQRIQPEFADMIQALVILFVAMPALLTGLKIRKRRAK